MLLLVVVVVLLFTDEGLTCFWKLSDGTVFYL